MIRVDMIRKVVIIAVGGKIGKPFLPERQPLILERLEDHPPGFSRSRISAEQ
jgi:hypothetical protein